MTLMSVKKTKRTSFSAWLPAGGGLYSLHSAIWGFRVQGFGLCCHPTSHSNRGRFGVSLVHVGEFFHPRRSKDHIDHEIQELLHHPHHKGREGADNAS